MLLFINFFKNKIIIYNLKNIVNKMKISRKKKKNLISAPFIRKIYLNKMDVQKTKTTFRWIHIILFYIYSKN